MSKRQNKAELEAIMYLGPTLPNSLLRNTAMYADGVLPSYVKKLSESDSDIAFFLVSVSKIAEIKIKLRNKSSLEYARFVRILETYKGAK